MNPSASIPALVLAAGLSTRMGAFKPLLPLRGVPLLHHVIQSLRRSAAVHPILIVTGHRADEVQAAVAGMNVRTIFNPRYADGEMLSSVRIGIEALPGRCPAFLLAFADQPAVSPDSVASLVGAWSDHPAAPLVLPTHLGKRGHPVVLSTSLVPEIRELSGSDSLKTVVHRHLDRALLVPVPDPAILDDLDTPDDFARAAISPPTSSDGGSHA